MKGFCVILLNHFVIKWPISCSTWYDILLCATTTEYVIELILLENWINSWFNDQLIVTSPIPISSFLVLSASHFSLQGGIAVPLVGVGPLSSWSALVRGRSALSIYKRLARDPGYHCHRLLRVSPCLPHPNQYLVKVGSSSGRRNQREWVFRRRFR